MNLVGASGPFSAQRLVPGVLALQTSWRRVGWVRYHGATSS